MKMNKKIILIGLIVVIAIIAVIGIAIAVNNKSNNENNSESEENKTSMEIIYKSENEDVKGKHFAEIVVKNYGTISLELDENVAPITVANFIKLVNEGFYDGLTFHRVISGFMIQGGDPLGNGTGGSDETIKGEFKANGVANSISHVRGTISMARSNSYNSASSQFFIMHEDGTYLDGQYAAFGTVTSGMDIVDKICEDTEVTDNNGTVAKENQPVIEKITIID